MQTRTIALTALSLALAAASLQAQTLKATPTSLAFSFTVGATTFPAAQSLAVAPGSGATALNFAASTGGVSWLTVTPDTGKTNATLKVSVNPTSLAVGNYTAAITLTPVGGTALNVPVTLSVVAPPATLVVTPNPVTIAYARGDTLPLTPTALNLNGGGALLSYSLTIAGATWLTATPMSGIIFPAFNAQVALIVDPTGLAPGRYSATVTVNAPSAANKTQTVTVNLTVNPGPPTLTSIFPVGAVQGSPATTLTLNGTNFYSGTVVTADGNVLASTLLGSTVMQATLPASMLATATTTTPISIMVTNPNPGGGTSTTQSFTVYPPGPRITGITNGSSFVAGSVTPGEFVNIFGSGMGPDTLITFQPPTAPATISTTLAGVQVFFDATPAPLIYVSSTQIAAMVPNSLTTGIPAAVTVVYGAATSAAKNVMVDVAAPGLFALGAAGSGKGAVFNVDPATGALTLNSDTNQVLRGNSIWVYGTGVGPTTPAGVDGAIITAQAAYTAPTCTLNIGGTDVTPDYFGPAPGLVSGLVLVIAKVPAGITASKTVPIYATINSIQSQTGVTISVK